MKKISPICGNAPERTSLFTVTKEREEAADIEKYPVKFKAQKRDFFGFQSLNELEIKYHNVIDIDEFDDENEKLIMVFHDNSFVLLGCNYTTRLSDVLSGKTLQRLGFVSQKQCDLIERWHAKRRLSTLKNRAFHISESIKSLEESL